MWVKKKNNYGKNVNYSISRKLKKEKRISDDFEVMLNSLTLEEIIALRLENGVKCINNKLYGLPIWSAIPNIIKEGPNVKIIAALSWGLFEKQDV